MVLNNILYALHWSAHELYIQFRFLHLAPFEVEVEVGPNAMAETANDLSTGCEMEHSRWTVGSNAIKCVCLWKNLVENKWQQCGSEDVPNDEAGNDGGKGGKTQ